jgi:hypothetical protein
MSDEYTNKDGYLNRYFTRWATELGDNGYLRAIRWQVCDRKKFDNIVVAEFAKDEKEQAEAVCKLMNSINEEGT